MLRKVLAAVASVVTIFSVLTVASPATATQPSFTPYNVVETRALTLNTNFAPEADESSVEVRVEISMTGAQYQAIASGSKLKATATITTGGNPVSHENYVNFQGAVTGSGSNTIVTNGVNQPMTINLDVNTQLLAGTNYQVSVALYDDGVAIAGSGYTVSNLSGDFYKSGPTVTAQGTEDSIAFRGFACLSSAAFSSLASGDVLTFATTDTAGHTYNQSINWYDNNYTSTYGNNRTLSSNDLTAGLRISYYLYASSISAGLYDPAISITRSNDATNYAASCSDAPAAAPTLAATATGITMTLATQTGSSSLECYLADARYPLIVVANTSTMSGTSCFFTGLKRGDYVGWYTVSRNAFQTQPGYTVSSRRSPTSTSVTYAGGNGAFATFTGTTGGSGQGALALTDITYDGFDVRTFTTSSDGQGGMLIASIQGGDNEISIRRLTPTGMDSSFGGSGTATLNLQNNNPRSTNYISPRIGWYGTASDKWVYMTMPSYYYGPDGNDNVRSTDLEIAVGTYSGGVTNTYALGEAERNKFCRSVVTGAGNTSYNGSISGIISAPKSQPQFLMNCWTSRTDNGNYYDSQLSYIATINSSGELELVNGLQAEPTAAEPCSTTAVSGANSGATGTDAIIASFQTTWLPTSGGCYNYSSDNTIASATVVSRDVYIVTPATANGATPTPVTDVLTVTGATEPRSCYGSVGAFCQNGTNLLIAGPNVYLMSGSAASQGMNATYKYRVAVLANGSFGTLDNLPFLTVAGTNEFSQSTRFSQIADYSENDATSLLLLRNDSGAGSATTASRVAMNDGATTSFQQITRTQGVGQSDGFSTAVGNASGSLNFYGIESRTDAVLGQWVTAGAFDSGLAALPINQGSSNTGVSNNNPGPQAPSNNNVAAAPYAGPVIKALKGSKRTGSKVEFETSNLTSPTKVTINEVECEFEVVNGQLQVEIPASLKAGTYDLVVTSASGKLTVQDAINVMVVTNGTLAQPEGTWTKRTGDKVRLYAKNIIGSGKVQFFANGKEIAWTRATTELVEGAALKIQSLNNYLVRTVELQDGKNVFEIFVNGARVNRAAYTK